MLKRLAIVLVCFGFLLAGCAGGQTPQKSDESSAHPPKFAAGTTMAALQAAKSIRIGVKFDQPNLGYKSPDSKIPTGFDIEIAKIIAEHLGLDVGEITWVRTDSVDREQYLLDNTVDIVVASYSMTPQRQNLIGQAGPYLVTGQQIMVRKDDADINTAEDLKGRKVCTVTGSSSTNLIVDKFHADPWPTDSYAKCVDALLAGTVEAVSTDGAVLMGFLINHTDEVKIVGEPFTTERYGIGYKHGDKAMCKFLTQTLLDSYKDGSWSAAFEETLGKTGVEAPTPPQPDKCQG